MASLCEIALLCRLCTDNKQVNVPIFEDHGDKKVFLKINACLRVKISKEDQLPKKICDICWNKLDVFYKFQNTSSDSEKTLSSWLAQASQKDDYQTSDALAEQIANPIENLIKEETEAEEEISHLDLDQHSSIDEEAEEPPAKRPRRSAAIKAQISIAPESEDEDELIDDPDTGFAPESEDEDEGEVMDEPDTVDADAEGEIMDEPDTVDADAIVKLEDDDDDDCKPETSAYDQPGPSGLCKQEADELFMIKNEWTDEIDISENPVIDPNKGIYVKEEEYSYESNSPTLSDDIEKFHCNKFKTKNNSQHLNVHQHRNKDFECYKCNAKFEIEEGLKRHSTIHLDDYPFECDTCKEKFERKNFLNQHLKTHSNIYRFECDTCKAKFRYKSHLIYHVKTHWDVYPFECGTCGAKFKYKTRLNDHLKTHSDVYPFECGTCGAKVKAKGNFNKHLKTHIDVYPFECDSCEAKFKNKSNLNKHLKMHTDDYPFECDTCEAKFKNKSNLNRHLKMHTDDYPFECDTCKAKFKNKNSLNGHLKTHSDDYPFKCDTCEAKFKYKQSLIGHLMTHSDVYPFECDTCEAKFKNKSNLTRHLKTHFK